MSAQVLRVGTRGSPLARWQADRVCAALRTLGRDTTVVEISTTGDLDPDTPIESLADPNLFTRQIDEAMLAGRIDLAVHSLKDLPTALPPGILLAATGARVDARDALISRGNVPLRDLPHGATVASSSLRRRAQLLALRPDLSLVAIRGNVHTRLARVEGDGPVYATVLAVAGLVRLGLAAHISERIPLDIMLPAPGQAALAITARADDADALSAARRAFNHHGASLCVTSERALLRALEGGCEVPVAAYATLGVGSLVLRARVVSLDGRQCVEGTIEAPCSTITEAERHGTALAMQLLERGAGAILAQVRASAERIPA